MNNISLILPFFQLILTASNIIVLAYALLKFLSKPHDTLEQRVNAHDVEIKEIKASLLQGNDRFREQSDINEIMLRSVLALIEYEIQFCITEKRPITRDLEKAKDDLHDYLAKKKL